jgi:pimeloyl-ACP methyl ester carboxylesterase
VIEPFTIRVDDTVLDDLRERLGRTRVADELPDAGWDYGLPSAYLCSLVDYWRDEYDWRAHEARLNELDHFRTTIDGQAIHFVRVRASQKDAFPIMLVHGWPGSFAEFLDVIPRLGAGFDLVIPSLPGYGFSEPTRTRGWDPTRIARAFAELMHRLGYDRYGAQGGDWGAQVVTRIGAVDPEHCAAIHLNMPIAPRPKEDVVLTDADKADLAALSAFQREEAAYSLEQGTKPQTLAAGLTDSPAGLLAWIVEKFRAWSDCGGDPENVFTRDQLVTNVMIYWVTGTIASSMRLYREHRLSGETPEYVGVPTGVARYPKEMLRLPRRWVERAYNVTRWVDMPRGGHFAAMEQPELFADDVAAFFGSVR